MNDGADPAKTRTPKRSTVGVLIDSVNGYFNQRNIGDLIEAAEENDLHLVFYFGGFLEKDKNCGASSYAYTLPDPDLIDALIVYPQNISPFDPNANTRAILDQYQKIPVYSILRDRGRRGRYRRNGSPSGGKARIPQDSVFVRS